MRIEIDSLVKEKGRVTLVATIEYPESVHVNFFKSDSVNEKTEKQAQYDKLMAVHNEEHREIKKIHLGHASLMQADGE